jgi:dihydrofolate synthase / folylpolyglutamate synthase
VQLAQILFPLFGKVVLTPVDSPRSASVEDLLAAAATTGSEVEAAGGAVDALERALQLTPVNGLVVVTGSVYLVGQLRPRLVAGQAASVEPMKV